VNEKDVQDQIFEWLIHNRALVIRINSGAKVEQETATTARRFIRFATWQAIGFVKRWAGVSDILACFEGRFVAIECKAPGKIDNVSIHQRDFLDAVTMAGGLAIVADSLDIVMEALR